MKQEKELGEATKTADDGQEPLPLELLRLPDELLSQIIMEAMWDCTQPESLKNLPDLESYQRRLTNHPSLQPERIAFLGGICGHLRGIFVELKNQPSLWSSPGWAGREQVYPHNWRQLDLHSILPPSFADSNLTALTLVGKEMGYLPLIPMPTLDSLTELEVFGRNIYTNTTISEAVNTCRSLRTLCLLDLSFQPTAESAFVTILRALAPLANLRHLTVHGIDDYKPIAPAPFIASLSNWTSPVARMEITHVDSVTFTYFVRMMECFAGTLAVAIFEAFKKDYAEPMLALSHLGEISTLPALERLSITFGGRHRPPLYDHTRAGERQLTFFSPLKLVKVAPVMAYFDCSERLEVKTQAELDEVAQLVDRDGWRRLRLKLKTWEGDKGARWTQERDQDVVIG